MRKIISLAVLVTGFITFPSFTIISSPNSQVSKQSNNLSNKLILNIQFSFSEGYCNYTVSATINTETGGGFGYISQTCAGQSTRSITFKIWGANVIQPIATTRHIVVTRSNLSNFVDVANESDVVFEVSTLDLIADGITENGAFDE